MACSNSAHLIGRLRRENYDQYNDLIKMHLSTLIEVPFKEYNINMEDLKERGGWRSKFHLRKRETKEKLTYESVCKLYQLIEYIQRDPNVITHGIFRLNGSSSRQAELRQIIMLGMPVDLDKGDYTVHDCANVLKQILMKDLEDSILPEQYYAVFCQIMGHGNFGDKNRLEVMRLLLLLVDYERHALFQDLMGMLHKVHQHCEQNGMDAGNLGVIFAPSILCPKKLPAEHLKTRHGSFSELVAFMIRHAPSLFEIPERIYNDVAVYYQRKTLDRVDSSVKTIYTSVNKEKSQQSRQLTSTEEALRELRAYVQNLPDTTKKKKMLQMVEQPQKQKSPAANVRRGTAKALSKIRHRLRISPRDVAYPEASDDQEENVPPSSSTSNGVNIQSMGKIWNKLRKSPKFERKKFACTPQVHPGTVKETSDEEMENSPLSSTVKTLGSNIQEAMMTPCNRAPLVLEESPSRMHGESVLDAKPVDLSLLCNLQFDDLDDDSDGAEPEYPIPKITLNTQL